jgi:pimeloyl-ACP methyl ester carboxylesterase
VIKAAVSGLAKEMSIGAPPVIADYRLPGLRAQSSPTSYPKPIAAHLHTLPDGRSMAYAEYGTEQGFPIFYFHNHAGSRLEAQLLHHSAARCGFRLIGIDRPGIGHSDPMRAGSHFTFAADVLDIANTLGLLEFGALSWAGGTPFAFALAYKAPKRLRLLIALAPLPMQQRIIDRRSFRSGVESLSLKALRFYIGHRHQLAARAPLLFLQKLSDKLSHADRRVLQDKEMLQILERAMREAGRQGGAGLATDSTLCLTPCEFVPEQITVPVQLWHGAADRVVPAHHVARLGDRLPDCTIRRAGKSGHFFLREYAQEIFSAAGERLKQHQAQSVDSTAGEIRKRCSPVRPLLV